MLPEQPSDRSKTQAFTDRVVGDIVSALVIAMCNLGDRLGLFRELAHNGPATSAELAVRTTLNERYLREWLSALASAGYLDYDPVSTRFSLGADHVPVLADERSVEFQGGRFQYLLALFQVQDAVAQAFQQGGGVPAEAYRKDFWDGIERTVPSWAEHRLVQEWIAAMPDVHTQLMLGAAVTDVGCGQGGALLKLAQAFPNAHFVGYDVFEPSILQANARARAMNVSDRVRFEVLDVADGLPAQYDFIMSHEVIHDTADPLRVLRAIRDGLRPNGTYTFYGIGASATSCKGSSTGKEGATTFTGTLDHVTGGSGCTRLFGPGDGPAGWVFDRNYAGGGKVVRFAGNGKSGWLMPFHAEYQWQNPATSNHLCPVNGGTGVPCFYSSLGLAVSTDDGNSFKVVGQILQPSQPLSVFTGSGKNMAVGYGSLIVADVNGKHLDNPPIDPSAAYFYLFYQDSLPGLSNYCSLGQCMGIARAPYLRVVRAALSGDPHQVAQVFHKYDRASPDPWTQPATSDTPDESGTAGKFTPLWSNDVGSGEVLYDSSFDTYLAVYAGGSPTGIKVRASKDLIHWSEPIGNAYEEPGHLLWYPTLLGEAGDPTIGGPAPRVYFSSFPVGKFPNYKTAILESVPLTLSASR